jgi:branched-chain amino acid transport system permease protein
VYWQFWLGLLLVVIVLFARGGVMGLADAVAKRLSRKALP